MITECPFHTMPRQSLLQLAQVLSIKTYEVEINGTKVETKYENREYRATTELPIEWDSNDQMKITLKKMVTIHLFLERGSDNPG